MLSFLVCPVTVWGKMKLHWNNQWAKIKLQPFCHCDPVVWQLTNTWKVESEWIYFTGCNYLSDTTKVGLPAPVFAVTRISVTGQTIKLRELKKYLSAFRNNSLYSYGNGPYVKERCMSRDNVKLIISSFVLWAQSTSSFESYYQKSSVALCTKEPTFVKWISQS